MKIKLAQERIMRLSNLITVLRSLRNRNTTNSYVVICVDGQFFDVDYAEVEKDYIVANSDNEEDLEEIIDDPIVVINLEKNEMFDLIVKKRNEIKNNGPI